MRNHKHMTDHEATYYISNLCCANEEMSIRKKLQSLQGMVELRFDVTAHQLYARHAADEGAILKALDEIGMHAEIVQPKIARLTKKAPRRHILTVVTSGTFLLLGGMAHFIHFPTIVPAFFFGLSIATGGWNIALKAYKSVRNQLLDINVLMTVAVLGALALGQYAEAAAVIFLFALSLLIESLSIDRARHAIQSLMKLSPPSALVKSDSGEVYRPIEEIVPGARIVVKPGDRIPLDGLVVSGVSAIDQSMITGESALVAKQQGDTVFAGSFNQRGALEIRVTKNQQDSAIGRIIHLVEEAQAKRAPAQSYIESFAKYYTPTVFGVSVLLTAIPTLFLGMSFGDWFYRSLVLLVISCPCALLISTPITIVSSLTNAARHGILIKGGIHLEELSKTQCVAFDKTGTLTHGKPRITTVRPLDSLKVDEILRLAVVLETKSEHPLAEAFLQYAVVHGISTDGMKVSDFQAFPGKGVQAKINDDSYSLGNHQFAEELRVCSPTVEGYLLELEREGATVMILSDQNRAIGLFAVRDQIREQSLESIESLRNLGVDYIALLSGDSSSGSLALGNELNVNETRAGLLPGEKVQAIKDLQIAHGKVAMVGDGINDAPALATADVGIAMGGAGSDTALESADIVLMSDDLTKIPYAIHLGKKALSIIKQNVVLALTIKVAFILLWGLGITSLWLAILADDGVTLLVAINGMRMLRTNH
jgi:Cd2+/Zn2+-exporting ATPase